MHLLLAGTAVVVAAAIALAVAGAPMAWCLPVLSLTAWGTVVRYETGGCRHGDRLLERV